MNHDGSAEDIGYCESICEEAHVCQSLIRKQYRKVPGMVAMGLIRRVPVASAGFKRLGRIADGTVALLMDMKTKRPYGLFSPGCRLEKR